VIFTIKRLGNRPAVEIEIPDDTPENDRLRVAVVVAAKGGIALTYAVLTRAVLTYANLTDANLTGAVLTYAVLTRAVLTRFRLPTGETWEEYLTVTVPAFLVAGGKSIAYVAAAWDYHQWENCPMAAAFDVQSLGEVPLAHRPRAQLFVQFFDAGQIPRPA
jgi:hypothetical protein